MLKKRIIPRILVNHTNNESSTGNKNFACVTRNFSRSFVTGDPFSQAMIFDSNLADEIAVVGLNINNSLDWSIFKTTLAKITARVSTPLVAGGGIKNLRQAQEIMELGVEKLCISYKLDKDYLNLVSSIAERYGSQAVQISLDYSTVSDDYRLHGNSNYPVIENLERLLLDLQSSGMGEVVFTSIDCDGGKKGMELSLFQLAKKHLSVPALIAGGALSPKDFEEALMCGADGVISGTYFAKRDQNPMQLKARLATLGIPVRKM